jgi:hypothetical protein
VYLVRRLEPYFEPPSKAEDANSPVGPLQHHVAEPYLDEWKHLDWRTLSLGSDYPSGMYTPEGSTHSEMGGGGLSTYFSDAPLGGPDEVIYDFGRGYSPVFHFAPARLDDPNAC